MVFTSWLPAMAVWLREQLPAWSPCWQLREEKSKPPPTFGEVSKVTSVPRNQKFQPQEPLEAEVEVTSGADASQEAFTRIIENK
jgi:hypothetical protein